MNRKIAAITLILALLLGLTACSKTGKHDGLVSDNMTPGGTMGVSSCPVNMMPEAENTYPYMGTVIRIPQPLLDAVLNNKVFMRHNEDIDYKMPDGDQMPANWAPAVEDMNLRSAYIEFLYLPEDMREKTPHTGMDQPMSYDEYLVWIESALPMARLSMISQSESEENVLAQTGYSSHEKLGEDSGFVYYFSSNESDSGMGQDAQTLFSALDELKSGISICSPRPLDEYFMGITTPEPTFASETGNFSAITLDGQRIDQTIFTKAKLTMVNVWATWCGPCVAELPDLEEVSQTAKEFDVQIIGIAYDTYSRQLDGTDQEVLELAQQIASRTGITFPALIPDSNLLDGLLQNLMAFPTTFFVDSQGNVVGDPVLGSNSTEDWMRILQERLEEVDG